MAYLVHLAVFISTTSILAVGLNLVVGYTGLLSVTHAAFYGIGAYTAAIFMTSLGVNFFLALLIAVVLTAICALLIGFVLSKFKGDYFALGSFGFNIIVYSIFLNAQGLTRGPLGIPGIPRPEIFGFVFKSNISYLILCVVFLIIVYFVAKWVVNSSFGRVLKAIREDEEAIRVFGYNTLYYKLAIFVIAAAMAAIAGALYASYITFIDPSSFVLFESIFMVAVIILGGLANIKGSMLGALILVLLPELLRFVGFPTEIAAQMRVAVYGLILILLMMYRPQGLIGEYKL